MCTGCLQRTHGWSLHVGVYTYHGGTMLFGIHAIIHPIRLIFMHGNNLLCAARALKNPAVKHNGSEDDVTEGVFCVVRCLIKASTRSSQTRKSPLKRECLKSLNADDIKIFIDGPGTENFGYSRKSVKSCTLRDSKRSQLYGERVCKDRMHILWRHVFADKSLRWRNTRHTGINKQIWSTKPNLEYKPPRTTPYSTLHDPDFQVAKCS